MRPLEGGRAVRGTVLDAMINEATVDAYGEAEERLGLYSMIEDHLVVPFETTILRVRVRVSRIDLSEEGRIVAICVRDRARQAIPILDLPLPSPPPLGAEWIEAYRRWEAASDARTRTRQVT